MGQAACPSKPRQGSRGEEDCKFMAMLGISCLSCKSSMLIEGEISPRWAPMGAVDGKAAEDCWPGVKDINTRVQSGVMIQRHGGPAYRAGLAAILLL